MQLSANTPAALQPSAGGMVFAMQVTRNGNLAAGNAAIGGNLTSSLRYLHTDRLGSVAAVSNEAGAVLERLAYDPWGKRRRINGTSDVTDSLVGLTTDRGFTEHEHLDEMGLVHMNGRVYDPLIARFMSADPYITNPYWLQSFNRYSYVMNNPFTFTDPSGFNFDNINDFDDLGFPSTPGAPSPVTIEINTTFNPNHPTYGGQVYTTVFSDGVLMYTRLGFSGPVGPADADGWRIVAGELLGFGRVETPSVSDRLGGYFHTGLNLTSDFFTFGYSGQASQAFRQRDYVSAGLASTAGVAFGAINIGTLGLPALGSRLIGQGAATIASAKLPAALQGGEANVHVYLGVKNGEAVYTGITNSLVARQASHGERFVLNPLTTSAVTRGEARAIEQALIVENPGFQNIRNSISPNHSYYQDAVDWGRQWLRSNGF